MSAALHVDLDIFATNLARVRETVAPSEPMLVVKNDAYGHGLVPIVRRAAGEGVRWFGAFDVGTGREVRRELGEAARIFVWMTATADDAVDAVRDDLDIGVGDAASLEDVAEAARTLAHRARVHLKIDTGLHRNGVRPEEWPAFVARVAAFVEEGIVEVVGVWSHIAEASDADDDDARRIFDAAVAVAEQAGLRPSHRHLAASAASFARAEFRYDLVRIGAFAYGVRSAGGIDERDLGVRLISTLRAEVTSVEDDGAHIGLGALDGLPSTLGGRVEVMTPVGPRRLESVGEDSRISGWASASIGDAVTVFGGADNEKSPTDLAEAIGSVGEEILVRLSPLIPRRYEGRVD
ncbi:alanine racemase [Microbacterium sp. AG1240]|uniref:alanine racemase n=1 Tax=Microbacterium sp. AG1240 TaxID=2183992 RepID=UPI000EAD7B61|nr:alanine racemase [Microbacterium sp. AG1240]RKT36955.1 alanine racemase [Microbacterium sp. AG1240]